MLLLGILEKSKEGVYSEPDEDIRAEAQKSLKLLEGKLAWGERAGVLFTSISLGSILLLAALGLAITYGLMGVINLAHGELIMVGAYTTYAVQNLFKNTSLFDWYLLAAVPASFIVAAAVGDAARTGGDPLAVWPPAGDAARDLGHQPDADPDGAHDFRRAERAGGKPRVHVRRRGG